jgi:nicotinate phosphoribosyltransferase
MKCEPIITHLSDSDLYKFTMAQVVLHRFPETPVEFEFRCRTPGVDFRKFAAEIREQIVLLGGLQFEPEELRYLATLRYIKPGFLDFLKIFRLDPQAVEIRTDPEFVLTIRGNWFHTIWFEIPILSIMSEIYYRNLPFPADLRGAENLVLEKIKLIRAFQQKHGATKPFRLIEFGTRRRFSKAWQERMLGLLTQEIPNALFGTSNVWLAQKLRLRPIGTMAHEFIQAMQAMEIRLAHSQRFALQCWAEEYRGDLGIALTDTLGMDAFLRDFDLYFAKLFDGLRHDSGCPQGWTEKVLRHYQTLRIDAREKAVVYSDNLTIPKALALCEQYEGQIKTSYGIGTHLTCDIPGVQSLNMVIKMTRCNGQPVAKISDARGKTICLDQGYLDYLRSVFQIPQTP